MFPGLLGELVEATAPVTEASRVAVVAEFLVGFGNVIGREVYTYVGETRHGLNENLLVIGPSATGRKGDGQHVAFAPLAAAAPAWAEDCVASGLSSGEGLVYALRDAVTKEDPKKGLETVDPGAGDKRLCVTEPEFSRVLKMWRREGNILSNVLRDAWDGRAVLRTLTKHTPLKATHAHVSIIGHCTPEDLREHLADIDVANGSANRFLFIAVNRERSLPNPPRLADAVRVRLAGQVGAVLQHAANVQQLFRTPAAADRFAAAYPELTADRPGLLGVLLARGAPHVLRLACLFAVLDRARHVDVPHLEAALAWWRYCVRSVELIFANRTGNDAADRIRQELAWPAEEPERDTRRNIRRTYLGGEAPRCARAPRVPSRRGDWGRGDQRTPEGHGRAPVPARAGGGRMTALPLPMPEEVAGVQVDGDGLTQTVAAARAEPGTAVPAAVLTDTATTITQALTAVGWVVIWSRVLDAEVVFTRDQAVEVPAEHSDLPTFTLAELAVLAEQRPDGETLRAIVLAKQVMPGTRVVADTGEELTPARDVFPIPTNTTTTKAPKAVAVATLAALQGKAP